jgi:hypothetical protein
MQEMQESHERAWTQVSQATQMGLSALWPGDISEAAKEADGEDRQIVIGYRKRT